MIFYSFDYAGRRFTSVKEVGAETLMELSTVSVKEAKSSLNRLGEKIIKQKAIEERIKFIEKGYFDCLLLRPKGLWGCEDIKGEPMIFPKEKVRHQDLMTSFQ